MKKGALHRQRHHRRDRDRLRTAPYARDAAGGGLGFTHVGGCAANAAIDLGRLGVPAVLCCKVGADSFGDFVEETVRASGHPGSSGIRRSIPRVSIVCVQSSGERSFLYCSPARPRRSPRRTPDAPLEEADIVFSWWGRCCLLRLTVPGRRGARNARAGWAKPPLWTRHGDFQDVWLPKGEAALPHLDLFMPSVEEAAKLTGGD